MDFPTFIATAGMDVFTAGGTASAPSYEYGDFLLLQVETAGNITEAIATPSGWTSIMSAEQTGNTRLQIFYRWATGSDSASINDSGDHQFCRMSSFRGVDGFDIGTANVQLTGTTVTFNGITTIRDAALILMCVNTGRDTTTTDNFTSFTNANLGSITERYDNGNATANGGGCAMATGTQEKAGATGNSTCTFTANTTSAAAMMALYPIVRRPAAAMGFAVL